MGGLVKTFYFLRMLLAEGDDPEIKTHNTDLNNRNKLKEGL